MAGSAYSDYMGSGYSGLQKELGVGGGNPARDLNRRIQTGLGNLGLQRVAFQNELEPGFQNAIRSGIMSFQPGRKQSLIENYARMIRGLQIPELTDQELRGREAGFSSGTSGGMAENALNPLNSGLMGFSRYVYSPEFDQQQMMGLLNLYQAAQDPTYAQTLNNLSLGIQQSNMMKDQGNEGIGGVLGNLAGMYLGGGFGNLAGTFLGGGFGNKPVQSAAGVKAGIY